MAIVRSESADATLTYRADTSHTRRQFRVETGGGGAAGAAVVLIALAFILGVFNIGNGIINVQMRFLDGPVVVDLLNLNALLSAMFGVAFCVLSILMLFDNFIVRK